jgi:hypothetical protein
MRWVSQGLNPSYGPTSAAGSLDRARLRPARSRTAGSASTRAAAPATSPRRSQQERKILSSRPRFQEGLLRASVGTPVSVKAYEGKTSARSVQQSKGRAFARPFAFPGSSAGARARSADAVLRRSDEGSALRAALAHAEPTSRAMKKMMMAMKFSSRPSSQFVGWVERLRNPS